MFACFLDGKLHLEAWSISPGFGGILQAAMSRSVQSSRGFHAHPCELRQSRIDFLVWRLSIPMHCVSALKCLRGNNLCYPTMHC